MSLRNRYLLYMASLSPVYTVPREHNMGIVDESGGR